jgi:hypothetical protein
MPLMTVSTAVMTVYILQRLHNFTHRLVISSLAKRLKVSIFPTYTSFGARLGDHHIVLHNVSQPAKYSH